MRISTNPQQAVRIRQEGAQVCTLQASGCSRSNSKHMVRPRAYGQNWQFRVARSIRYPSPYDWSGPLWVRPDFPPIVTARQPICAGLGRSTAEHGLHALQSLEVNQPRFLSDGLDQKKGINACGSSFLRFYLQRPWALPDAVTTLLHNHLSARALGPVLPLCWTKIQSWALSLGRRQTSPIATQIQVAANLVTEFARFGGRLFERRESMSGWRRFSVWANRRRMNIEGDEIYV